MKNNNIRRVILLNFKCKWSKYNVHVLLKPSNGKETPRYPESGCVAIHGLQEWRNIYFN